MVGQVTSAKDARVLVWNANMLVICAQNVIQHSENLTQILFHFSVKKNVQVVLILTSN
jgi:hypothetical protein